LSTEERIAEDGMPGVGGAMYAALFAVRRCIKGEGSDFWGGNIRTGGEPGDEGVEGEDMRMGGPERGRR
jgi:hypothetical protein